MKSLVLYTFHEINERVNYFFNHTVFEDKDTDFLVIINNPTLLVQVPPFVKVLHRENVGVDFGAWSEALLKDNFYKSYDRFLFLNSSALGPFLPKGFSGRWTDLYFQGLQGNVKLFGSTINTCKQPKQFAHIQSYIFAMEKETLELLVQCSVFSTTNYANSYHEAVWNKEVLMSRLILQQGWNIGCLMKHYKDVDFTFQTKQPEDYGIEFLDDILFEGFQGKLWAKEELVFIKGNRITNHELSL